MTNVYCALTDYMHTYKHLTLCLLLCVFVYYTKDEWTSANTFEKKLAYCVKWKRSTGFLPLSGDWGIWMAEQRDNLRNNVRLTDGQKKALTDAGVYTDRANASAAYLKQCNDNQLAKLVEYQKTHGFGKCPFTGKTKLATWMSKRLRSFYMGELSEELGNKLFEEYGLKEFDPSKCAKIDEVNGLGIPELKEKCATAGILTRAGVATHEALKLRLLRHIYRKPVCIISPYCLFSYYANILLSNLFYFSLFRHMILSQL